MLYGVALIACANLLVGCNGWTWVPDELSPERAAQLHVKPNTPIPLRAALRECWDKGDKDSALLVSLDEYSDQDLTSRFVDPHDRSLIDCMGSKGWMIMPPAALVP